LATPASRRRHGGLAELFKRLEDRGMRVARDADAGVANGEDRRNRWPRLRS
jgi:hypothetical protein